MQLRLHLRLQSQARWAYSQRKDLATDRAATNCGVVIAGKADKTSSIGFVAEGAKYRGDVLFLWGGRERAAF
jgi:hypothetical protein